MELTEAVTFDQDQVDFEAQAFELGYLEHHLALTQDPDAPVSIPKKQRDQMQERVSELKTILEG
jgi:hypothetical protein